MREEVAMGSGAVSGPVKWGLRGLRQPHNEELPVTPVRVGVGGVWSSGCQSQNSGGH